MKRIALLVALLSLLLVACVPENEDETFTIPPELTETDDPRSCTIPRPTDYEGNLVMPDYSFSDIKG